MKVAGKVQCERQTKEMAPRTSGRDGFYQPQHFRIRAQQDVLAVVNFAIG
jgi:hypothetical protein